MKKNNFLSSYPKQVLVLAFVAMFILSGFSFMWPLTSIYVTTILGKSLPVAGWVLAAEGLAGVVGSFFGGMLFDRYGAKPVMLSSLSIVILTNILLALSRDWVLFLSCFILMNMSVGILMTSISALAGLIWPEGGRRPYNLNYVFQNVGVAFGTSLGGFVSSISFSYSFLTNAFFFSLAAMLTLFGLKEINNKRNKAFKGVIKHPRNKTSFQTISAICLLGIGACFTMISYIQWQTTMPVFMKELKIPLNLYSFLWTINGILVIILQPVHLIITRFISSNRLQFLFGQLCLVLSFLLLEINQSYPMFVIAMGFVTLGEIIIWPAIPAFASKISPYGRAGFFQGTISIFNYSGRLIGPIIGTTLYKASGPFTMITVMIAFYLAALITFFISLSIRIPDLKHNELLTSENVKHAQ